jgi:hypothetical protein
MLKISEAATAGRTPVDRDAMAIERVAFAALEARSRPEPGLGGGSAEDQGSRRLGGCIATSV